MTAFIEKIDAVERLDIQIALEINDETHLPALDSYHFFRNGPDSGISKVTKVCKKNGTTSYLEEKLSKRECLKRARRKHYGKMTALKSRMKCHKDNKRGQRLASDDDNPVNKLGEYGRMVYESSSPEERGEILSCLLTDMNQDSQKLGSSISFTSFCEVFDTFVDTCPDLRL